MVQEGPSGSWPKRSERKSHHREVDPTAGAQSRSSIAPHLCRCSRLCRACTAVLLYLVYLNLDQSLGAAQSDAQCARWKTAVAPQSAHTRLATSILRQRTGPHLHSSTQSSLASPSASCCWTRSTHSSKWCFTGAHCFDSLHSTPSWVRKGKRLPSLSCGPGSFDARLSTSR